MNPHVSEVLPQLLTGEAPRDVVLDAAAHLRTCVDCQQELVSAVVAHASLTSAHRFAPEIVSDPSRNASSEPTASLPDLSAVFSQIREEAPAQLDRPSRRPRYLIAAAAAAVFVVGGGAAALIATSGDDSTGGRTVALEAFDTGTTPATATLTGDKMRIDAASLPHLAGKGYEVWLTDEHRSRMQPIGWINADGTASITVPSTLMSKYSDIEVSVQDVDAPSYEYSNVSVLRGDYA